MDSVKEKKIADLAEAGLAACLLKLSFVSPGEWRLEDVRVSSAPAGAALPAGPYDAAIQVSVGSEPPFNTALLFPSEEVGHLAACFADDRLAIGGGGSEVTLLEIGNIVLNALVNSLLKALKKSAIPSVPVRLAGPAAASEGLPAGAGLTVISASVSAIRSGRAVSVEIAALLPAPLADGL